jgi:hypothetical protein
MSAKKKLVKMRSIVLLSLPALALSANFRAMMDPEETTKNECNQHTLCSSCLEESDCVWCADGQGSCVPGTIDDGPKEDGTCKDWESSYCLHEPCAAYSQCSTCTSDAFCGWSNSEETCVEGDSEGPLTGSAPKWVWSDCQAASGSSATGAATGSADEEAADAMKDAESSVEKLHEGEESAMKEEKQMVGDEKKTFNVIKHLKAVINAWRGRKAEIAEAESKDRALFESAFNTMQEGRKKNFEKLLDSYNHMELSLEKDEELLRKREDQEAKFGEADQNEDDRLMREGEQASDGLGKDGKELKMPEDHAMGQLEDWVKTLSSKEVHMLRKLGKKSGGSHIEKEMHVAATRKQKREEASWYACQFKLTKPSASCMDFHSVFAGTVEKHQNTDLTEEEHMRVCNSVEAQLGKIPHVPAYQAESSAGKQKYLGK